VQTCCTFRWKSVARCATTWIYTASTWDRWASHCWHLLRSLPVIRFRVMVRWLVVQWTRCCVVIAQWQRTVVTVAAAARAVPVTSLTRTTLPRALKWHTRVPWDTLTPSNSSRCRDVIVIRYFVRLCRIFHVLCLSPLISMWCKCVSADRIVSSIVADHVVVLWCFILGVLASFLDLYALLKLTTTHWI